MDFCFFYHAEDGIRFGVASRGLVDVYMGQVFGLGFGSGFGSVFGCLFDTSVAADDSLRVVPGVVRIIDELCTEKYCLNVYQQLTLYTYESLNHVLYPNDDTE